VTVYLVGAGPGDADLLTLRAARLLSEAHVVVHDRLIDPSVLALVSPAAELIDVGKVPGGSVSQSIINDLLIALSQSERRIVRLKGGDPFVFGRGGEEMIALREAGVSCDVVPGVTSAFSGPLAAGIPVTHRGVARGDGRHGPCV
jgi:uroporphyrin-III C-methyltransferase